MRVHGRFGHCFHEPDVITYICVLAYASRGEWEQIRLRHTVTSSCMNADSPTIFVWICACLVVAMVSGWFSPSVLRLCVCNPPRYNAIMFLEVLAVSECPVSKSAPWVSNASLRSFQAPSRSCNDRVKSELQ